MARLAVPTITLVLAAMILGWGSQRSFADNDNSHFTPQQMQEIRAMKARGPGGPF